MPRRLDAPINIPFAAALIGGVIYTAAFWGFLIINLPDIAAWLLEIMS